MRVEGFHTTDDGVPIWWGMTGPETGPLLVLCDGIGCDGFIWAHLIDHFCPDVRILRWHYRGHGRSGAPDDRDGLRLERLAADLNEIHRALDLPPGIIAGHSMGVQLSLEYYRQSPDQCTALVLLCGSYGRPMSTFQGTDLGGSHRIITIYTKCPYWSRTWRLRPLRPETISILDLTLSESELLIKEACTMIDFSDFTKGKKAAFSGLISV